MDLVRYGKVMARAAEGLFELADRDRHSPAYGCFDYPYWRSKTSGYINARLQEASLALALLYRNDYPGNRCRAVREVGELARAGLLRWAAIQHPDPAVVQRHVHAAKQAEPRTAPCSGRARRKPHQAIAASKP